jgi:hypothetical protein
MVSIDLSGLFVSPLDTWLGEVDLLDSWERSTKELRTGRTSGFKRMWPP